MKSKLIEFMNDEYVVVFDTNVYLNLYEYSPHVTDAFINILSSECIKNKLYIPSTVKREFYKNYRKCRGRQRIKIRDISQRLKTHTEDIQRKISKQLDELARLGFPNINELEENCRAKIEEVHQAFDDYEQNHRIYQRVCTKYFKQDKVFQLVQDIENADRALNPFTIDELYDLCEVGKQRYAASTPPGFADTKGKDGIEKYNDLLLWKEAIQLSKEKNCNMIFVTDDVKPDWRMKDSQGKMVFHSLLEEEFSKETGRIVLGLTAYELATILSEHHGLPIPDALESVLEITAEEYVDNLVKSDEFISELSDELMSSSDSYIDTESLSNYDGSYFELQEIYDIELVDYYYHGSTADTAEYEAIVRVSGTGRSREYWGRDDETKDIILGSGCTNILEGELTISITRQTDEGLAELIGSYTYDQMKIESGCLAEIDADYDYDEYEEEDIAGYNYDDESEENDSQELICPKCREIATEGLMSDGYCSECSEHEEEKSIAVNLPFEHHMGKW